LMTMVMIGWLGLAWMDGNEEGYIETTWMLWMYHIICIPTYLPT
jgi:hypothetical protein